MPCSGKRMATAGDIIATAATIEDKLRDKLGATDVVRLCDHSCSSKSVLPHHPVHAYNSCLCLQTVLDTSGGCALAHCTAFMSGNLQATSSVCAAMYGRTLAGAGQRLRWQLCQPSLRAGRCWNGTGWCGSVNALQCCSSRSACCEQACLQVNTALAEELRTIHALAIKRCWTPEQQAAATAK